MTAILLTQIRRANDDSSSICASGTGAEGERGLRMNGVIKFPSPVELIRATTLASDALSCPTWPSEAFPAAYAYPKLKRPPSTPIEAAQSRVIISISSLAGSLSSEPAMLPAWGAPADRPRLASVMVVIRI